MKDNRKRLFGTRKFYGSALSLAVPIMLQQLVQSLVSLIDNFMVSGLGDVSMSGVNVAGQVLFVFFVYLNAICMAGGIFMTQFYGAEDRDGMKQAFLFKLIMGFAAFVPFLLVCMVFPREVLSLMVIGNTEAEPILDEAVRYINIVFFMGVPLTASMCIASSLRDMGKVKAPLAVTIAATLVNTLFNWLLIYGNLGFPALGVQGAAAATV
ncbi:MAG: MATE family efflux transporter, partial [Ruminiclostridium sp.]|nr:MATE family efflux transporter [Ruminiclostridium sp.]